jgi:hypothetical protein
MFVLMKECLLLIVDIDRPRAKKEFKEIIVFNKQRKNLFVRNIWFRWKTFSFASAPKSGLPDFSWCI